MNVFPSNSTWTLGPTQYNVDPSGFATMTQTFSAPCNESDFVFVYGSVAAAPYGHMYAVSYTEQKGETSKYATVSYEGVAAEFRFDDSIEVGSTTEPIESHINFKDWLSTHGGTATTINAQGRAIIVFPSVGAMFESESGDFLGFQTFKSGTAVDASTILTGDLNEYAGIVNFFSPTISARRKYCLEGDATMDPTILNNISRVSDDIGFSWLTPTLGDRTWIKTGVRARPIVGGLGGYHVEEDWLLSGPRGWQTTNDFPYQEAT